jgi:mono/diheme cytochrome c family protein
MKNRISPKVKFLIALAPVIFVLMVVVAANLSSSTATAANMIGNASEADASANYAKYCNRCHGGDGRGQTAKGKQTRATDLTTSRIGSAAGSKVIANGKELMPGFKGNLSAAEIGEVMNFVKGFRK